jgi:hypothetical protein
MADITVLGDTIPTLANNDRVFFAGGSTPVVNNLDHSALTSGLGLVQIDSARTGNIGTVGSPLIVNTIKAGTKIVNRASAGTLYWRSTAANNKLYQHFGTGGAVIGGAGSSTLDRVEVSSGFVSIGEKTASEVLATGGSVTFESNCETLAVEITGGSHIIRGINTSATVSIYGGNLIIDAPANNIATINIFGGNVAIRRVGTIGTSFVYQGGSLDTDAIQSPFTITNPAQVWMNLPNARRFLEHPSVTFIGTPQRFFE